MARQAAPHSTAPIWLMTGTRRFRSLCKRPGFGTACGAACGGRGTVGVGAAGAAAGGVTGTAVGGGAAIAGAACFGAACACGGATDAPGILHGARSVAVRAGSWS